MTNILVLLSKDFVKIIVTSFLFAVPVAFYSMEVWLQGFAYRIAVPIEVFIMAGIGSIMVTAITISSQAIKATLANPIDSLADE